ncbi:MAG: extracellular solute-binding protein [Chloroflexi bacterium]|nr:extracellular solute-binding protein [Chloroflexota bacterium]
MRTFSKFAWLAGWLVWGFGLVACGLSGTADTLPTPTATIAIPTPVNTPASVPNTAGESPTAARTNQLIVWTIPSIAPRPEIEGGPILADQLDVFNDSHPDIEVIIEIKAATGQGSIVSYLEAGRPVAPSILPDLILIPTDQVGTAVAEGLIYPLETLLPAELIDDLYPVGRTLGEVNNTLYAYPYAFSGLTHLAYDRNAITTTLPTRWADLNQPPNVMVLPANGKPGADLLLQFYLAEGGVLSDDNNQPLLEVEPLTRALRTLATSQQENLLLPQSNALSSMDDAWLVFQTSKANLTLVAVSQFLRVRGQGNSDGFAAVPGLGGPLPPRVSGWAWAISTADPARQALAAELITWLVNPPNHAEWSQQSLRLPSRYASFAEWPHTDPYIAFLETELERSLPYPVFGSNISDAFRTALVALTSPSGEPPDVLAEQAAQAVRP